MFIREAHNVTWLKETFGTDKPIIAMAHLPASPATPMYDRERGIDHLVETVAKDVEALQAGGVTAIMFCNENDRPYLMQVGSEVVAAMTRVIAQLLPVIRVPFGCDLLWDPVAALSVAHATGGRFVREVFTGLYAGDIGLWNTRSGEALRHRRAIGAESVRCLYNITAEFAHSLDQRPLELMAKSAVFSSMADAILISGSMTGEVAELGHLQRVKAALPDTPVFANTGVKQHNVKGILQTVDGVIVGTSLKVDGVTWNPVDGERVKRFVAAARG